MKQQTPSNWSHPFEENDVSDQFQGMEVEFNDKVTLFPVQVEKQPPRRSSNVRRLRR